MFVIFAFLFLSPHLPSLSLVQDRPWIHSSRLHLPHRLLYDLLVKQCACSNSYLPLLLPPLCPDLKLSDHYYTFIWPQQLTNYSIGFIFPTKVGFTQSPFHSHCRCPRHPPAARIVAVALNLDAPGPCHPVSLFALLSIYYFQIHFSEVLLLCHYSYPSGSLPPAA